MSATRVDGYERSLLSFDGLLSFACGLDLGRQRRTGWTLLDETYQVIKCGNAGPRSMTIGGASSLPIS
jgi:hypothetical protein